MARVELNWETWDEFWPAAKRLVQQEYDEYKNILSLWKPLVPDEDNNRRLVASGILHICVARLRGVPVGYIMVTIVPDLESTGVTQAIQGPWYCGSKAPTWTGMRLFRAMMQKVAALGGQDLELHHPIRGRGLRLDKFFVSLGAIPTNMTYHLKLGKEPVPPCRV